MRHRPPTRALAAAAVAATAVTLAGAVLAIPSPSGADAADPTGLPRAPTVPGAIGSSSAAPAHAASAAQPPPPLQPPPAQPAATQPGTLTDAKAHMDKGQELFLTKRFAEAAVEFRAAYATKPFSTFLFNEAVCHEKVKQYDDAIRLFQKYVDTDVNAPDRTATIARIERLKKERDAALPPGGDAGVGDAMPGLGDAGEAGPAIVAPTESVAAASIDEMRSIVVVESLPDNAPVEIWSKSDPGAAPFHAGGANAGWTKVVSGTTTLQQSLPLGTYHVVLPKFQDYRATETDIQVAAATISQFKANLAQGAFYGVLKVRSFGDAGEVRGAHVFIKRPGEKAFADRGVTPYEESLESGKYTVRVEQPGFRPRETELDVVHGKIDEQKLDLARSDDGLVRLEVTGAEQGEVFLDGNPVTTFSEKAGGKAEVTARGGHHTLKVKADGRKAYEVDVDVPKGKLVVVHAELRPKFSRGSAWVSTAISAGFLGAGIIMGLQANKLRDELSVAKSDGRLDQDDSRTKRGQYYAIGADIAFVASGGFALLAIYDFIRDPLPPSVGFHDDARDFEPYPSAPRAPSGLANGDAPRTTPGTTPMIAPLLGPSIAGLSLSGVF